MAFRSQAEIAGGRSLRDEIPSFWNVCARWVSTVFTVTKSSWAISLLARPSAASAASAATRRSLAVNAPSPLTGRSCGRDPSERSFARVMAASRVAPQRSAVGGR